MALPLLIGGGMMLGGAIAGAIGGRKARKGANRAAGQYNQMAQDAQRRHSAAQGQANESRNMYMDAARGVQNYDPMQYHQGFDPRAYAAQAGGAMTADALDQMQLSLRGNDIANRARGFNSPAGGANIERNTMSQLARGLSGLSMQAAGMQNDIYSQANQMKFNALNQGAGMIGNIYGQDVGQSNMFYDAATGLRASGIDARNRGAQAAAGAWGQVGGSLMGLGGTIAGKYW